MARSFTNAKALSVLLLDGFSNPLARRGYAATAQSATTTRGGAASMGGKMGAKSVEESNNKVASSNEKVSWVPDPITGYYKPENIKEIDVADLRAALLTKKFNH